MFDPILQSFVLNEVEHAIAQISILKILRKIRKF